MSYGDAGDDDKLPESHITLYADDVVRIKLMRIDTATEFGRYDNRSSLTVEFNGEEEAIKRLESAIKSLGWRVF